jgi:ribonuclease HI
MTGDYIIYADGACSGNPGPGGWAFEIHTPGGRVITGSGGSPATTNNIMELTAAAEALEQLANERIDVHAGKIFMRLDSQYVLDGMFKWLDGWKTKNWKTASKKPVKNRELWERIDAAETALLHKALVAKPEWVKGHDGEPGNERVDTAAQEQRDRYASAPMSAILTHAGAAAGIPVTDIPVGRAATQTEQSFKGLPEHRDALPFDNTSPLGRIMNDVISARVPQADNIHPVQVELMRTILDLHASGDYSVKKVIEEIRANAVALGCR